MAVFYTISPDRFNNKRQSAIVDRLFFVDKKLMSEKEIVNGIFNTEIPCITLEFSKRRMKGLVL